MSAPSLWPAASPASPASADVFATSALVAVAAVAGALPVVPPVAAGLGSASVLVALVSAPLVAAAVHRPRVPANRAAVLALADAFVVLERALTGDPTSLSLLCLAHGALSTATLFLVLGDIEGSALARAGYGACAVMIGILVAVLVAGAFAAGEPLRGLAVSAAISTALASLLATRVETTRPESSER